MPNGDIEFIAMDNQVKRALPVSLEEIKGHLADLPGVSDAFVNVNADGGDQILCAYVKSELPDRSHARCQTLRKALAGVIPAYMIDKFVFCTELPIDNGKLTKQELRHSHKLTDGRFL